MQPENSNSNKNRTNAIQFTNIVVIDIVLRNLNLKMIRADLDLHSRSSYSRPVREPHSLRRRRCRRRRCRRRQCQLLLDFHSKRSYCRRLCRCSNHGRCCRNWRRQREGWTTRRRMEGWTTRRRCRDRCHSAGRSASGRSR